MATSGTYSFAPSAGDLILNAFSMGPHIRRYELTTHHLEDAYFQANLQMVEFSNRNPNRWALETVDVPLLVNTPTYTLPNRTLAVALARVVTTLNGVETETVIGPLSGTDYASLPSKLQIGRPCSFWFNLLTTPQISVWPVAPQNSLYTLRLYTFRQMQDVIVAGAVQLDAPFRFLDAMAKGLAYRLSSIYPKNLQPNEIERQKADYDASFMLAAQRDQEGTPMYVRPDFSGYYR